MEEKNLQNKKAVFRIGDEILTELDPANMEQVDEDIVSVTRENLGFIQENDIKVFQDEFWIGDEMFLINILEKKGRNTQKYFVPHDDEDTAFDAGLRAIKHGGVLIALENNGERNLFSFGEQYGPNKQDPNRMFFEENHYWPLAERIKDLLFEVNEDLVITLHNNKPKGDFHLGEIETWNNIDILSRLDPNEKSMIWIAGNTQAPNRDVERELEYYKDFGLNVVYEFVPENSESDGSLSMYSVLNGRKYRNIEIMSGKKGDKESEQEARQKQIKYLDTLRNFYAL
ncbi:hypothetical protein C0583_03545 [Candidatus Parcubacteria bacterium]|nr:MAG: hypothetical protein C0583_03545 [Candidatus Parcubacteria bacterium]